VGRNISHEEASDIPEKVLGAKSNDIEFKKGSGERTEV